MQSEPKFSIVIPSYNYAHFLGKALDSVFQQQRSDIQVLVVDDASEDDTPAVALRYTPLIEYIRNDKNLGAGGAWKTGLARAKGKYLIKLDADDELLPGHLDRVEKAFESNPGAAMVMCSVLLRPERNDPLRPELIRQGDSVLSPEQFRDRFLRGFFFRMPGCALRRACVEGHELPDDKLYQLHDWEYFLRVTKGHEAVLISQPSAVYRLHSASITSTASQSDRLQTDIRHWLSIATSPGERALESPELDVLRGSFAILLMISGIRSRFGIDKYRNRLTAYRAAASLSLKGGMTQVLRLHLELAKRGIRMVFPPTRSFAVTRTD